MAANTSHAQPVAKPRPEKAVNLAPDDIPLFKFRFRILENSGKPPTGKFNLALGTSRTGGGTNNADWSPWFNFTAESIKTDTGTHAYPNTYMRGWPFVVKAAITGLGQASIVEVQTQFEGFDDITTLKGNLQGGGTLGLILAPAKDSKLAFTTMAQYNRDQFWSLLKDLPKNQDNRPKNLIIADRFIPGDSDIDALKEGIENLARIGFNTLADPTGKSHASLMKDNGVPYTASGVYSPPGYTFQFTETPKDPPLDAWAQSFAKPFADAGQPLDQVKLFAMADEPGWYYPSAFESLKKNPEGLKRFRDFLIGQKLTLQDIGATSWDQVFPIGQSQATTLEKRKLFYWTMRFFPWDSSRYFADANRAMEKAFYPGFKTFNNWNFFSGRSYVPGAVANNGEKSSPDAAMGGQDWFEYARLKGTNVLWVEDWFADNRSYQWSSYMARLDGAAIAARPAELTTGGYIVPRTAGDMPNGILQKITGLFGYGGKSVKYFVFGPEYNFPSNCYSFKSFLLPKMAQAHAMVAKAEPLLYPGKRPAIRTAILYPRSAQMWDIKGDAPKAKLTLRGIRYPISDATNNNLDRSTVDYLAEFNALYVALQHQNIPATFIDEEQLTPESLKDLKVLYITTPNLPAESVPVLLAWVNAGGTLVTTVGAGSRDRYDDPLPAFAEAFKLPPDRDQGRPMLIDNLQELQTLGSAGTPINGYSRPSTPQELQGGPALVARKPTFKGAKLGQGQTMHYEWLPGLTYLRSAKGWDKKDQFPSGFSTPIADQIAAPVSVSLSTDGQWARLSHDLVETPLLTSEKGTVMTLLNWNNAPIPKLTVSVKLGFTPSKVESVTHGPIKTTTTQGLTTLDIPLDAADYVLFYK
jgi:hypothetical protein